MKKNVIAALLPVAGLAMMASAQVNPASVYTNSFGTMEIRWAVDGDGRNAEASNPLPASLVGLLPGAHVTAVGLTLQARVMVTGVNTAIPTTLGASVGNYGVARVSFTSSNSYNRISHNDAVSFAYTGGLSRGQVSTGPVGTGPVTGNNLAGYAQFGATPNFRAFVGGYGSTNTNNWNAADGNAVAGQNLRPGNTVTSATNGAFTVNGNLSGSSRARIANGFQENGATGTKIAAFDASLSTLVSTSGTTAPVYTELAHQFSAWVNMYRVVFNPRPNAGTDVTRDVSVTVNAGFQYLSNFQTNEVVNPDTGDITGFSTLLRADNWVNANGQYTDMTATARFTVPTPAAAALLGLGGLAAFRRRRA